MNKIIDLKDKKEDYEFYPTTNEILHKLKNDIISTIKKDSYSMRKYGCCYDNYGKYSVVIDSFLDIGAGDGRVLQYMSNENEKCMYVKQKCAIEKASGLSENLIKSDIGLIGSDFFECTLIDRSFNIVFSNPPFSIFKKWCTKIIEEVNSNLIYFVIPVRWENDDFIKTIFNEKGKVEILGEYNFQEGDRKARGKVNLIKITCDNEKDTFTDWIEKNIGQFEIKKDDVKEDERKYSKDLEHTEKKTDIDLLVSDYNYELNSLLKTFKALNEVDFGIITELGIGKMDVISKIKDGIKNLKNHYWRKAFDILASINKRLTHTSKEKLLSEIKWFEGLDFNRSNVYNVVIWVIENFNKYQKEQLLKSFNDLTNFEKVRAYKSNDRWFNDKWRYNGKDIPEKYTLDYRIVVPSRLSSYSHMDSKNNIISDLCIVANSIGWINDTIIYLNKDEDSEVQINGLSSYYHNKIKDGYVHINEDKYKLYEENGKRWYKIENYFKSTGTFIHKTKKGEILFEVKLYQNGNAHFKLNKEFIKDFNIEVGKLKGWLKKPSDIKEEFNIPMSDAIKYFDEGKLNLLSKNSHLNLLIQKK